MLARRGGALMIESGSTLRQLGNPRLATWQYTVTDASVTQSLTKQELLEAAQQKSLAKSWRPSP